MSLSRGRERRYSVAVPAETGKDGIKHVGSRFALCRKWFISNIYNQREEESSDADKFISNINGRELKQFLFGSSGKEMEESTTGRRVGWIEDLK